MNEIKNNEEKTGGRQRQEHSFVNFKNFLADMEMGDIVFNGPAFNWANNREGEGYIQERLDRFCESLEWMVQNENAEVTHVLKQTSDHALVILDSDPKRVKTIGRFLWHPRKGKEQEDEEIVKEVWGRPVEGSRMFRVSQKLKWCKPEFIKQRKH